jgi:hypothetical protein
MNRVHISNPLDTEFLLENIYISVRISQETRHTSATKPNRIRLLRGTKIPVYFENHMKHTSGGQYAGFCYVKVDDTYSSHWAVKG